MSANVPKRESRGLSTWMGKNPFDGLREEMDRVISSFSSGWKDDFFSGVQLPSLDLAETDKEIEVKVDVPGFKPEEIKVEVQGNLLFVRGEHKEEKEEKDKTYHRVERRSGSLERRVTLPAAVNPEKVSAQCRDGVLTITLAKAEGACARKIEVKS